MIIRIATKVDKVSVQCLMDELNLYRKNIFSSNTREFHDRVRPYEPLRDEDFSEGFIFVAIDDVGDIVGFIQGNIYARESYKLYKAGYIEEFYLKEAFRGTGIAKMLFSELESAFKKEGCCFISTHTDFENKLARHFYFQAGMFGTTIELWKRLE